MHLKIIIHMISPNHTYVFFGREYEEFKTWWNDEIQHSHNEGVTLIVVDHKRGGTEYVWKNLLTRLEEEEFDTGEEMKVKFTTLNHLLETVSTGKLPLDMWGDTIERGPRASVFYKDIMFVIPNNNDVTIEMISLLKMGDRY